MRLWQLIQLAKSPRNGGEDAVQAYYGWRDTRALTVAKGTGGAAVSLLTAWLIPFLKDEYSDAPEWLVASPPVAVLALALVALASLRRMDLIHRSFVRATAWLQLLR